MSERIKLPMACLHGDERKAQLDELRGQLRTLLELKPHHNLVDSLLYHLDLAFKDDWFLSRVRTDQWMGITIQQRVLVAGKYEDGVKVYIECDSFEDGLATAFKYIWDNHEHDEDY